MTDPSDVQRAKTLVDVEPLLGGMKSLLHVGEQLRDGWEFWPDWFRARGITTFDVLEIYGANVEKLKATGMFRNVYEADVRDVGFVSVAPVDVVFWWHGPEHILKDQFQTAIDGVIAGWQPKLIILGMPWGRHGNCDRHFDNAASYHVSTWYPAELEALGWTCRTDGPVDVPSGHISAWKTINVPIRT